MSQSSHRPLRSSVPSPGELCWLLLAGTWSSSGSEAACARGAATPSLTGGVSTSTMAGGGRTSARTGFWASVSPREPGRQEELPAWVGSQPSPPITPWHSASAASPLRQTRIQIKCNHKKVPSRRQGAAGPRPVSHVLATDMSTNASTSKHAPACGHPGLPPGVVSRLQSLILRRKGHASEPHRAQGAYPGRAMGQHAPRTHANCPEAHPRAPLPSGMAPFERKIWNAHLILRPRPLGGVPLHRECQLSWAFHVRVVTFLLAMRVLLRSKSILLQ